MAQRDVRAKDDAGLTHIVYNETWDRARRGTTACPWCRTLEHPLARTELSEVTLVDYDLARSNL
eukprot:5096969-Prymnesium_polylepis.3